MNAKLTCTLTLAGLLGVFPTLAGDKAAASSRWTETLVAPEESFTNVGRNEFFILEPGYQRNFVGKEGGKKVDLLITVLDETKTVGGVETRVVEERESANGELIEVSRNYFAIGTQSHHVYYFGEEVNMFKKGKVVSHEGSWLAGAGDAKKGIAMPGDAKSGQKYFQEQATKLAMDHAEHISSSVSVVTPAGKFEHCLKVKETTPLEPATVEYKFYAPGVGLVQDGDLKLVKYGFVKK